MATIADVIVYFCQVYPRGEDLSKARVAKMLYLSDWKSAITADKQITPIKWHFNHYGPYVRDIVDIVIADPRLSVTKGKTWFGNQKEVIFTLSKEMVIHIDSWEKDVLDFVIQATKNLSFAGLLKLVYSTYPISCQKKYDDLDLVKLARKYGKR